MGDGVHAGADVLTSEDEHDAVGHARAVSGPRRGGFPRGVHPLPRALLKVEAPEIVEAAELALPAEDVELIVHDDGGVAVPPGWDAHVRVRRPRLQLGALVLASPPQDDVHELTLGRESSVGVELIFPDHGGGADEVPLGVAERVLLVARVEVLHGVARRGARVRRAVGSVGGGSGGRPVPVRPCALFPMRGGAGATLGLLIARDGLHELGARVTQGYAARSGDLFGERGGDGQSRRLSLG